MKIYRVGGAVRDALLGLPAGDTDWVVVGASPEAMVARGFTPVGRDFPVFLHPGTHEEYALARTERKTARGYHGFVFNCAPEVTLEEDLARRDLTINAIAQAEDGSLIDPFGGQADLAARILRHVGPAFAEDPVRILRLARFAARFPDFTIAPETMALMRAMVAAGEVDALVPERSWQEIARGLATTAPARMFASLRACGALARILPELDALPETEFRLALAALDRTAAAGAPAEVRFAALCARLALQAEAAAAAIETLASRLRVPGRYRTLAALVAREYANIVTAPGSTADQLARLVGRLDLVRRPERLEPLLAATCAVWAVRRDATTDPGQPPMLAGLAAQGRVATHSSCEDFPAADWLRRISAALARIDAGAVAAEADSPGQIPARIHAARVAAIRAVEDQRPR